MKAQGRVVALLVAVAVIGIAVAIGAALRRAPHGDSSTTAVDSTEIETATATTAAAAAVGAEAVPALDVPARMSPQTTRRQVRDARRLLEQGKASAAESLLLDVVDVSPASATAWNVLGRVYLALDRIDAAHDAFTRACDVDSTHAWAHNNLGWLSLQNGDWRQATPALEAAVRLDGDIAVFHNNLAAAYERGGRDDEAMREYARAVELHSGHATAGAALARLRTAAQAKDLARTRPTDTVAGADSLTRAANAPDAEVR